jgi:pentachlorophenol monooxygenase/3-(3-hydroxy-phenyl)propionate hydroxylase
VGVPTVVVEAAASRDEVGSKAICMQRDVLDVFARIGVADALVAGGRHRGTSAVRTSATSSCSRRRSRRRPQPFPPWVNVPQATTTAFLKRVGAEPLIDVRSGHEVVGLAVSSRASR